MGGSKTKLALAEAERTIRIQTETIKALRRELAAAQETARRLSEAEQSAQTLTEQRERLVQLCDELGVRAHIAVRPASTIALDLIRWGDWLDGVPQQPITEA